MNRCLYFSATGNTRHLARLLAHELGYEAVSVTDVLGGRAEAAPFRVLCFPVHGWRVPKIVGSFLRSVAAGGADGSGGMGAAELYVLLTCGDDCGKAVGYLRRITDPLGIGIAGAFSLTMPESYVGLPFMDVDTKEREQEKIRAAERAIPRIAGIIRQGRRGVYEVDEGGGAYLKSKLLGGIFHRLLVTDATFRVDARACISCGRCERACPVGNIALAAAPGGSQPYAKPLPSWRHNGNCLTCLACYHVCPRHAVSFNWQTKRKGQYCTLAPL